MTELTRTPGPWSVRRMSTGDWQVIGANGEDVTVIADDEPAEGDARLMAAGPESLDALKAVIVAFEHNASGGECNCDGDCDVAIRLWTGVERVSRAAIAKAEGRVT